MNKVFETITTSNRHYMVLFVFILGGILLLGRALYVQHSANTHYLSSLGAKLQNRVVTLDAPRGDIVDRNDNMLAKSIPVFSVCLNPQELDPTGDSIEKLATLLSLDPRRIHQRLARKRNKQFMYVKRQVVRENVQRIKGLNISGVFFRPESRRYYPMGEFSAHLLGVTNIDGKGIEGLEYAFDKSLKGHKGNRLVQKDRYGRIIADLHAPLSPRPGQKLVLSMDSRIQYHAHKVLSTALLKNRAKFGSIVVLDPATGEVLSMVNAPSFNPNDRSLYDDASRRNRAMVDIFEPGSTIKPLVMAALLQYQRVQLDQTIDTAPGYYFVSNKKISDERNLGTLSAANVLVKSSNVGMGKLSSRLSSSELWEFLSNLGFGQMPGTSFPGEMSGQIKHFSYWKGSDHAILSYGYGISVSLLQLAHAYTIIANDGWQPSLSLQKTAEARSRRQIIEPDLAQNLRQVLQRVVSRTGTSRRAKVEGYTTAGKSGTTRKFKQGQYMEEEYVSLFVGMVPASAPRLVIAVIIDSPKTDYYGGKVAAPVFAEVAEYALQTLGVPYDEVEPFYKEHRAQTILTVSQRNKVAP